MRRSAARRGCIIHTHSTHLVALSAERPRRTSRDDLLPPITPYFVMKVGHVPLIAYHAAGRPAVGERVAQAIDRAHAAAARRSAR